MYCYQLCISRYENVLIVSYTSFKLYRVIPSLSYTELYRVIQTSYTELYRVIPSYTILYRDRVIPYCDIIPGISRDILWPKVYLAIYLVYRKIYFLAKVIP